MNNVCKDIFRAIHEGKWLYIEYKNKKDETTKYWVGIKEVDVNRKSLQVDGLHLGSLQCTSLFVYIESIVASAVIEGSYQPVNYQLVQDLALYPEKYDSIFRNTANLKILNYLADCNKLDCTPYNSNYSLVEKLDLDVLNPNGHILSDEQFKTIVASFQKKTTDEKNIKKGWFVQLGMNVLSISHKDGLYILAYKKLNLDVKRHMLVPDDDIIISKEFAVDGTSKMSIRKFLDADDFYLLDNIAENKEVICDRIIASSKYACQVDDIPYIVAIGMNCHVDLNNEYAAIIDMYETGNVTAPIKAFFGDITTPSRRRKDYPIALLNRSVNLDQLLAIHNAVKYPLTYIQGPPGTGKTNTIINTITTAFFNERTVLFSSYNNHPIDSVFKRLSSIKYRDRIIPFPILRVGNKDVNSKAIKYILQLIKNTKSIAIFDKTLDKNRNDKTERTKKLTELLKRHEELLDLKEREETIEKLVSNNTNFNFQVDLHARQLNDVRSRINEIGSVTTQSALQLLDNDEDEFKKYLYYTSAKYIKRLQEPKYDDFRGILYLNDDEERLNLFSKYLNSEENLKKLMRVFPIMVTTCISAHNLGEPKSYFDMCIIDEASQCNIAMSLVPILRANTLMLVGDPQQLSPVILIDNADNITLRKKYQVSKEYDYVENSIYKTFLACDSVSDEILLSYHYRCHKDIIGFSNKKYYNNKLNIMTDSKNVNPLVFCEIPNNTTTYKNTAPYEAEKIVEFALQNKDKCIGVITPFANQKDCINSMTKENGVNNVTCGTVHAFQGDEKDIIIFSLALTDKTQKKTYDWLKNNKELINVATSRAKEQLIILSSMQVIERLCGNNETDDIYELVEYVRTNGKSVITPKSVSSRALGIKPYSTETEEAFLTNLNHALGNILQNGKCTVQREVAISQVFKQNIAHSKLFYTGRFDFVVYEKNSGNQNMPLLAIELDGKEHFEDEVVKRRDKEKNEICRAHGFELIRVENSYARRYNYIKTILIDFFNKIK